MRRSIFIVMGSMLAAACSSKPASTPGSVSGISPTSAFLGRSARIEIDGSATKWSATAPPVVSFGSGVTVDSVQVASPTALFAQVTVDAATTSGLRDVQVGPLVLSSALSIVSPVAFSSTGTLAQGSFIRFAIFNLDPATPFDPVLSNGVFPNLQVVGPAGTALAIEYADSSEIRGLGFLDLDAASGPLTVHTDAAVDAAGDLSIAARAPVPLVDGIPASAPVTAPGASSLFAISPSANPALLRVAVTTSDAAANPFVVLLPASGHWNDALDSSRLESAAVTTSVAPVYVIVVDPNTDESGYEDTVTATSVDFTVGAEVNDTTDNSSSGAMVAGALPFLLNPASVSSATDQDWVKITAGADDVGKSIHVRTFGDPLTDTAIAVFASDATTQLGYADDVDGPESLTTFQPISSAGTYYVEITPGVTYDAADTTYEAAIWIE